MRRVVDSLRWKYSVGESNRGAAAEVSMFAHVANALFPDIVMLRGYNKTNVPVS